MPTIQGVTINIDGPTINKMIADAILESVLGESLKTALKKSIDDLLKSDSHYSNPVKAIVQEAVEKYVRHEIETTYAETIGNAVKKALNEATMAETAKVIAEKILDKSRRGF